MDSIMNSMNFDLDINPLFIFYVTLGGNFVAQLFPCQVQKLFTENIYYSKDNVSKYTLMSISSNF